MIDNYYSKKKYITIRVNKYLLKEKNVLNLKIVIIRIISFSSKIISVLSFEEEILKTGTWATIFIRLWNICRLQKFLVTLSFFVLIEYYQIKLHKRWVIISRHALYLFTEFCVNFVILDKVFNYLCGMTNEDTKLFSCLFI